MLQQAAEDAASNVAWFPECEYERVGKEDINPPVAPVRRMFNLVDISILCSFSERKRDEMRIVN